MEHARLEKVEPYCPRPIPELLHGGLDQGSLLIFRGGIRSDPTIYPITTSTMINEFELPRKGSGAPNHWRGDLLHTMAYHGLPHVRTELHLLVIPPLVPHPIQVDR